MSVYKSRSFTICNCFGWLIGFIDFQVVDTLLKYKADPSMKLTHGLGSILCVATSFQAERRRTSQERMKLVSKHLFLTSRKVSRR